MIQRLTCILCPNGCDLTVETDENKNVLRVEGNTCPRGMEYARQEMTAPKRNIATSVLVTGGTLPLASVRLTGPIPKEQIFAVTDAIHAVHLTAPVTIGQVVLPNVLGLGVDVIATRNVPEA